MTTWHSPPSLPATCDVAIVGGGPSGLAAATCLKQAGVGSVLVLERESEAGGIPRHCGHPPFGMREFHRCMTGPRYASALVERARRAGVDVHVSTTVTGLHEKGKLLITTDSGCTELVARRVVLCTGVRETPRSARLVSGGRPLGIFNTGALQSMVYLKQSVPFRRPVIVGTELVSFSALLTCRHARIRPVAMIEAHHRITARSFCRPLPALLGVPLHLNTRIAEIMGKDRVTGVRVINGQGNEQVIGCDGVLFTGQFTPESSLLRMGHLAIDAGSGGPVVDQYGRCSDPTYFATGNLLRPVETAGWCWNEGRRTAAIVSRDLAGRLPDRDKQVRIASQAPQIKFTVPQMISLPHTGRGPDQIQLRFDAPATGRLSVRRNGETIWEKEIATLPERRILIPLSSVVRHDRDDASDAPIDICFTERG